MEKLYIKATSKSFEVDCSDGRIRISGCSILNDPKKFFKAIETWIDNYTNDPPDETVIDFKIEYSDSASTKNIFELLISLEKILVKNKSIIVNWHYDKTDPEIVELGNLLSGKLIIPFNFIPY